MIGAGGAGLRAAIEASAAGVSVGLVCKSLLGKAHTDNAIIPLKERVIDRLYDPVVKLLRMFRP